MALASDFLQKKPNHVPEELWQDVLSIYDTLSDYLRGLIPEDQFRRFRLLRGIYGQRQPGVQMVRVKIPLGRLKSHQLKRMGELSKEYGNGRLHITTRQDIQFHFVPLERVPELVAHLAYEGLTTREACGNTVRNVTACPLAGLCPEEHFDVTPYARAVSRYFLRHPLVQNLPRKFKIAFSGCEKDCAVGWINDIGFIASSKCGVPGGKGFRMVVGGGLGPTPEVAHPLREYVPIDEVIPLCEAVLRVFDQYGERRNRTRARLKFLIRRIGMKLFADYVALERAQLPERHPIEEGSPETFPSPSSAPFVNSALEMPGFSPNGTFKRWLRHSVTRQKQEGFCVVTVFVPKGDLTADQAIALADVSDRYGKGLLRTTISQNLLIPWVEEVQLSSLYQALEKIGLGEPYAHTLADVVSCPAASTCRLGVTRAKNLADLLMEVLKPMAEDEDLQDVTVKMSGCPNACGQHYLGTIGFHGAAASTENQKVPCYQVLIGGRGPGGITLGRKFIRVPAHRVPELVLRLITLYRQHREEGESLYDFFWRANSTWLTHQVKDLADMQVKPGEEDRFFCDIGETEPFKVEVGEGECAA